MRNALRTAVARWWGAGVTALLVLFFLVLQAYGLHPYLSDEGIYFYDAVLVTQGKVPYRDFFLAHPPLHVLFTAGLFQLAGGYSLLVGRCVPVACGAAMGVLAYLCARRAGQPLPVPLREGGAAISAAALLLAEGFLAVSTTDTGACQAALFAALAMTLLLHQRPAAAGASAALAVMNLLQAVPVVGVIAILAGVAGGRRAALRFAAGLGAVLVVVHAVFLALSGWAFVEQVYLFHLRKTTAGGEAMTVVREALVDSWTLLLGGAAAAGLLALCGRGGLGRPLALSLLAMIGVHLLAVATRPRAFPYYVAPAFFPAAVALGLGAGWLGPAAWRWWRAGRKDAWLPAWAAVTVTVLLVGRQSLVGVIAPHEVGERRAGGQSYRWRDAPLLGRWLNGAVRALFWEDGFHAPGATPTAITRHLWELSQSPEAFPELVARARALGRSRPGAALFGFAGIAPLVALEAGIPLLDDMADTNTQRMGTGSLGVRHVLARLDQNRQALVLLRLNHGLATVDELTGFVRRRYRLLARFESAHGQPHVLYQHRSVN